MNARIPLLCALACVHFASAFDGATKAQTIVWTSRADGRIQSALSDGSGMQEIVSGGNGTIGLAIDVAGGRVYWSEDLGDEIRRANLDGTDSTVLIELPAQTRPQGIALDLAGGRIYWAAYGTPAIQSANLDGTGVQTLVELGPPSAPVGVALDTENGVVYWSDSLRGTIQRADLDGNNVQDVVTGAAGPYYIAVDGLEQVVYWASFDAGWIDRARIDDGVILQPPFSTPGGVAPVGIALDAAAGRVYWTLPGTAGKQEGSVGWTSLDGTSSQVLISRLETPWAIEFDPTPPPPPPVPALSDWGALCMALFVITSASIALGR
ncbi:MAG: PQQ-binding-like beta-propeller repeat protein [Phycisphaerales bacterium]|nr:PQQ-binding-like beta-propeller repeat protein [Phycisphaerales bacterium]